MNESAARQPLVTTITEKRLESRSFWRDAARHLWRDGLTMVALAVLIVMTFASLLGPPIVEDILHVDITRTAAGNRFAPPSLTCQSRRANDTCTVHALGTDHLGRDQLVRLIYGGRISLGIAYSAGFFSILIGVVIGVITAYYGGRIDDVFTWFITTLSSIPPIFLLILAASVWSPSPEVLVLILSLISWIETARLVRGEVLALREREFIIAAHALGATARQVIIYHILPNLISIVVINLTIFTGLLILIESSVSFLGLGVQPPTPTWGNMLTDSRSYFVQGPHLVIWPGLLIMITVLCFYLLGDGLRDALDPRTRK